MKTFESPIHQEKLEEMTKGISDLEIIAPGRACIIWGGGSQTRFLYWHIKRMEGCSLAYTYACTPWFLYPLSFIAAAQAGLVVIEKPSVFSKVYVDLANLALAEAFFFNEELLPKAIEHVKKKRWKTDLRKIILRGDDTSACFLVDGDHECETKIFSRLDVNDRAPDFLLDFAKRHFPEIQSQ